MGRELYGAQGFQVYTTALDSADRNLSKLGAEWSLVDELIHKDKDASRVSDANISQPACTAVQLCLVDLLRSWGIRPSAVTGHSSGEIAAAYAAGFITFKSAMSIAYHRGRMIPQLKASHPVLQGTMLAVGGSKEDIQPMIDSVNAMPALQDQSAQARIACYNSASSLTISGDTAAIAALESAIREKNPDTFNRRLQVDVAYHSHHMDLVAKDYRNSLDGLQMPKSASGVKFYSSLHGRQVDGVECDAAYWVDNLTRPVRFNEALTGLVKPSPEETAVDMLVELGPHSALQGPIKQVLQAAGVGRDVSYGSALIRKQSAIDSALDLASTLVTKGGFVNVDAINSPSGTGNTRPSLLTDLPRYAWNHQKRYWHESRLSKMHTHRNSKGPRNELIGIEAVYSTSFEPAWRNVFFLDDLSWLRHHRIQGLVVFPLAAFITMAVEAASQQARNRALQSRQATADFNAVELRDVEVLTPLAFPADVVEGNSSIELSISLRRRHNHGLEEAWDEFHICSWSPGQELKQHCVGLVMTRSHDGALNTKQEALIAEARSAIEMPSAVTMDASEMSAMYADLTSKLGVEYGPSFQALKECNVADQLAVGNISTAVGSDIALGGASSLHPAVLESVIEMYWPVLRSDSTKDAQDTVYLPSSIRHMCIAVSSIAAAQPLTSDLTAHCSARFGKSQPRPTSADILATSASPSADTHSLVVAIEGLVISPILDGESQSTENPHNPREVCFKLDWEPLELLGQASDDQPSDRPLPDTDFVIIYSQTGSLSYMISSQLTVALDSQTSKLPVLEEGVFDRGIPQDPEAFGQLLSGKTCIVMTELDQQFLTAANEFQFETFKALAIAADRILWVTQGAYLDSTGPSSNMVSGLSRTIRSETTKPFAHLDLHPSASNQDPETTTTAILGVLRAAFGSAKTGDMEFIYRSNTILVPRVVSDAQMNLSVQRQTNPLALELQPYGEASADGRVLRMEFEPKLPLKGLAGPAMIREVRFVDDLVLEAVSLADDEIEFEVKALGVSVHDASVASTNSTGMGLEASGVVTRVGSGVVDPAFQMGSRISCLTTAMKKGDVHGAYANRARTAVGMAFPLPASSTFEEAAALPLAYSTAYHALITQARVEAGERVLVTCPSAVAAQAAICLSLMEQSLVYLLVDSPEEKAKIAERYTGVIPENRVLSSSGRYSGTRLEHQEKYDALTRATDGKGFDVVLDLTPLTEKISYLKTVLRSSLAPFGHLVHVQEPCLSVEAVSHHNIDAVQPSCFLDELPAPRNASYVTVDMLALGRERPQVLDRVFSKVAALFQQGQLASLQDMEILPFSQAHEALNNLHVVENLSKKVVLVHKADDLVLAPPYQAPTSTRILKADATYVIVGGTGGLGRSMAKWMVSNGARHIVLLSRRATVTTAVQAVVDEAATVGARVFVRQCDIADETSTSSLLEWIANDAKLPPIRGVIHSAMVLHDVLFEKMSYADYKAVIESKVQGAWNLHRALDGGEGHASTSSLDFFVAISSVSAIVGNRGQAAYAAANAYLDALVQHRLTKGLPAVSLALAAVSDAGYLADSEGGAARAADVLRNLGGDSSNSICEAEVLALLRAAIVGDTASCHHHVITGVAVKGRRPQPFWAGDAKFARIQGEGGADDGDTASEGGNVDVVLNSSLTQAEAEEVVCRGLVAKIAVVLMMEPEELDVTRSLSHYPLDSLVAIEIRNFIARQYEASLQVLELLSSGSIQTLSAIVCRKSKLCQSSQS
ncbi:unnamed protein product [Discula destructiva]